MVTPLRRQVVDQVPEQPARLRLDARGRLVEEQHRRAVQDGAAEREPLLPAAGQRAHQRVLAPLQPGHARRRTGVRSSMSRARHPVEAAEEAQILAHGEVAVEREFLRHVADMRAHRLGLAADVEAGHRGASGARPQQPAQHADGGRFAGAVRADEPHDLALGDAEIEPVDGGEGAEFLGQALGQHGGSRRPSCRALRRRAGRRTRPRCRARSA